MKTFEIHISSKVEKFLNRQNKEFVQKLNTAFQQIKSNPYYSRNLDIKKMQGARNDYRLRLGKCRIIYSVNKKERIILVYKIDKRGDIY